MDASSRDVGIRASFLKAQLAFAPDLLGRPMAEAVLRRIPAGAREAIDHAVRTDWLGLDVLDAVNAVVFDEAGEAATRRLVREVTLRLSATPVLQPFVRTAITLLGLAPDRVATRIPSAMAAIYRGCGTFTVTPAPSGAVVVQEPCPAVLLAPRVAIANEGGMESVFAICGWDGQCRADIDAAAARVTYRLEWHRPKTAP